MAVVEGNKAAYFSLEGNDTCIIAFELFGDSLISVEQVKGSCLTGIGVVYSGSYYSAKYAAAKSMDKDKKVQLLDDAADNALLKKLVGSEYDVFVSTTQQTTEDTDVDNFNAKVYTSGVAGLFTLMENIIIINANKDIWAAVINDSVIDYYTTRPDYYSKLPITIDKWRSRFEEDKIIYKSHK
ncbi:MAG: hypothetical protein JWQ38_2228, partial [Flavipsychrobacter sp.]|nr:hypothetical protein [Flavipsychrobacter sp.]